MRITSLGHACLLVETGDQRILIDPGTFSPGFQDLTDLDAIVVTHQHADHVDASTGCRPCSTPTPRPGCWWSRRRPGSWSPRTSRRST